MHSEHNSMNPAPAAQLCGILISIWQSIHLTDLVNAAACAATGTMISFIMTLLLRYLFRARKKE